MMDDKPYKVYQLTFAKTLKYIGFTKKNVHERIQAHQQQPVNVNVKQNFEWGRPYEVHILRNCETEDEARYYEKKLIIEAHCENWETLLNIYAGGTKLQPHIQYDKDQSQVAHWDRTKKYSRPPDYSRHYRCSKCKVTKPGKDFYRDRTRFNGLHSVCKSCANLYRIAYSSRHYHKKEPTYINCTKCNTDKITSQFVKATLQSNPICKTCYTDLKCYLTEYHTCTRCKETKLGTEFYPKKGRVKRLASYCKSCTQEACKESRKKHKKYNPKYLEQKKLREQGLKKCPLCNQIKSRTKDFTGRSDSQPYAYCKSCRNKKYRKSRQQAREYYLKYKEKNKDKIIARQKAWKAKNKDKVAEYKRRYRAKKKQLKVT